MTDASRGIWLVTLRFSLARIETPTRSQLADDDSLDSFLARVLHTDDSPFEWPWSMTARLTPSDFASRTDASISFGRSEHIAQCVHLEPNGDLVARYLFDQVYARAHPEALDDEHLGLLHGVLAAKIYDEDVIILDREGLSASLRWVGLNAKGVRLTRTGGRG